MQYSFWFIGVLVTNDFSMTPDFYTFCGKIFLELSNGTYIHALKYTTEWLLKYYLKTNIYNNIWF